MIPDNETDAMIESELGVNQRKSGMNIKMILAGLAVVIVGVVVVIAVVVSGGEEANAAEVEAAKVSTETSALKVDLQGATHEELADFVVALGVEEDSVSYEVTSTTVAASIVVVEDGAVLDPQSDAYAEFTAEFEQSVADELGLTELGLTDNVAVTSVHEATGRRSLEENVLSETDNLDGTDDDFDFEFEPVEIEVDFEITLDAAELEAADLEDGDEIIADLNEAVSTGGLGDIDVVPDQEIIGVVTVDVEIIVVADTPDELEDVQDQLEELDEEFEFETTTTDIEDDDFDIKELQGTSTTTSTTTSDSTSTSTSTSTSISVSTPASGEEGEEGEVSEGEEQSY